MLNVAIRMATPAIQGAVLPARGVKAKPAAPYMENDVPQPQEEVGVGVLDGEPRADQFLGEVDHRVGEEGQGDAVDHDLLALTLQHDVVLGRIVEADVVLEPRTAAAVDRDPSALASPEASLISASRAKARSVTFGGRSVSGSSWIRSLAGTVDFH
jgi:hypothetical protein